MAQGLGSVGPTAPVVAGYRVEELVGFGGCGEVWRARDVLTGRLVALKRLHHDGPPAERDRLRREAAVLAGLSSPHIVRLLTVVTSADGLVLVLEFQGGGSLASLLQARGSLAPGEVVTIAAPLAAALAEVHVAGLVHGDVSPANLLFATDGRPVISDLGVARLAGRAGSDAVTAAYAAPEVLLGAPVTRSADVYGLAAVCFEALCGRPPFPGAGSDDVLAAHTRPRPSLVELAPAVPAALAAAIEEGLCTDVAQRPDAATFGARLLEACPALPVRLAGASVPVVAPPTAAVRRLPEPPPPAEPTQSRLDRLATSLGRVRLSPRRLVAAAAVPVALAGAIWGGVAWARSTSATAMGPAAWAPPLGPPRPSFAGSAARPDAATPAPSARSGPTTVPTPRTAVGAGSSTARPPAPVPRPDRSAAATRSPAAVLPTEATMTAVIDLLDNRRDSAFASGDAGLLSQVYAAGSAPLVADTARLDAMVAAGEHANGLALSVRTLDVTTATSRSVRLRVSDELASYALLSADGRTVERLPARALTTWAIELVRTAAGPDGWRIAAIARA